jgi:hypothetical protein
MPQNQPSPSEDAFFKGKTYSFVDEAHPVTEEERARPRYGRPQRKPEATPPEPPKSEPPVEKPGS